MTVWVQVAGVCLIDSPVRDLHSTIHYYHLASTLMPGWHGSFIFEITNFTHKDKLAILITMNVLIRP